MKPITRRIDKRELFDVVERLDALGASGLGIAAALNISQQNVSTILGALDAHRGRYSHALSDEGAVRFAALRADAKLSSRLEALRECTSRKRRAGARLT